MSLIKSISGIRGTIGGAPGEGLSPVDIVKYTAAYAWFISQNTTRKSRIIVVGRDGRVSGPMVMDIVCGTLVAMGFDIVNIGLASTPTTEIAVVKEMACGGLILTASHNPTHWNALKLLNEDGEFLSNVQGEEVLRIAEDKSYRFAEVFDLGKFYKNTTYNRIHIDMVLGLKLVDREAIEKANFKIAIDCINSVGGVVIPQLLKALGVKDIIEINCDPNGKFAHNPEPLAENLTQISQVVAENGCDLGFVVDPDVDRLAIIQNGGKMFGEENTLVSIADYVLSHTPGATVSNLSSSRALRDVTLARGCSYSASAVGEVNVVAEMKRINAVIGGEGNGGVIYPELHYGRDALVGIALFLTMLAKSGKKVSEIRKLLPEYSIYKTKVSLQPDLDIDKLLKNVKAKFEGERITDIDGVKIDFADSWVHLRKSNTEPIIRIYSEAESIEKAKELADSMIQVILDMA